MPKIHIPSSNALRRLKRLRILGVGILFLSLAVAPLVVEKAHAVSKAWDGGCGADTTWSCANNWSDDIVPGSGDTVTFDGTSSNNSTVDNASFAGTVTSMNINAGYTGTISLSASLTISGTLTQGAGTFSAANQALTTATLNVTGGTFTASSGTTSVSAAFTMSASATFNHNGGTLNINGSSGSNTVACGSHTYNLVTFTHTGGTKTVSATCNLPLGSNPNANSGGSISLVGTLSGTGTLTTGGTLTLSTGSSLSGFTGLITSQLTIGGTTSFASFTTLDVNSTFTLSASGNLTMPPGTATFAANFTLNSGSTFSANGGTVTFDVSTGTLSCGSKVFNLVTFAHTAGAKTINSDCTLPLGSNPTIGIATTTVILNGTLTGSGLLTANVFTINSSTADFSGFSSLDVNSTFTVNSGVALTMPSGTATFASTFTLNSGATFDANGGTVTFDGTATAVLSCGSKAFSAVTFAHTAGTKTVGSDCSLPLGSNPTIGVANTTVILNGTLTGSGLLTANVFTINSSTADFSGFSGLDVNSTFTVNSGAAVTLPSGNSAFAAAFTLNSGATFDANGGTVTFDGATASVSCGSHSFALVSFNHSGTKTVGTDCTLPLGSNPTVGGAVTGAAIVLNGTLSGSGTLTAGGLTLNPSSSLTGFSGLVTGTTAQGPLTISGATYDFGAYAPFDINGNLTLSSAAVFTAPSGTMSVGRNLTINAGTTFLANGGTLTIDDAPGGPSSTLACNNTIFDLVVINKTTNDVHVNADCNLPLGNNPTARVGTISGTPSLNLSGTLSGSGTLTVDGELRLYSGYTMTGFSNLAVTTYGVWVVTGAADLGSLGSVDVDGSFTVSSGAGATAAPTTRVAGDFIVQSGGAFTANNGTVVLDGTNQSITGDATFHNLTATASSPRTLTFTNGTTQTVTAALVLTGTSGNLLTLVSLTPGTPWSINPQGTRNVQYVSVSDSTNTNVTAITAFNSVNGGGNTNWVFAATPSTPGTPTAASPTTDATPTFSWTASTDADHYEINWSQSSSFSSGVTTGTSTVNSCDISTTTCGGPTGLGAGTWYVRVRAVGADGFVMSDYSSTGSVQITGAPTPGPAPTPTAESPKAYYDVPESGVPLSTYALIPLLWGVYESRRRRSRR